MKSNRLIFAYFLLSLLFIKSVYSQESMNMSFLGSFAEGPCFAVANIDSVIFLGNGRIIDIVEMKSGNILEKKSCFVSKYLINDIQIDGNILYAATDGGLYIINVSNISMPIQISFSPTNGYCKSVFVKNSLVYLVSDAEGLYIIDVSDPTKPNILSTFRPDTTKYLTQISATDTVVYLCDSMGKLLIVNTKERNNPKLMSTYDFGNKYYPSAIAIEKNYAYVGTTSKEIPRYLGKLFVLDISDPNLTKQVYSNYIPGDWYSSGRDVFIKDSLLFLPYVSDVGDGVEVYNISNPASPKILNSTWYNGLNSIRTNESYSVSLFNNHLFVAEGGFGMSVFSIADFNNVKKILSYETNYTINDLFVYNNIIFAACGYGGFNTYDYSPIDNITKTTKRIERAQSYYGYNTSVYVENGFAFLTHTPSWGHGLQIFDITGTDSFKEIGGSYGAEGNEVVVKDNFAYVAARFNGLVIFDITNLTQPKQVFNLPFDVSCKDLTINGNLCFLAATSKGMYVFDISNPSSAQEIFHFQTDSAALGVAVKDSVVFIAEGAKGLRIVNYRNPSSNLLINQGLTSVQKVRVDNNYLYLIDDTNGLIVYDISDPLNPIEIGYQKLGKAIASNIFINNNLVFLSQGFYGFSIYKNDLVVSIDKPHKEIPAKYNLYQNYPNPFNPQTKITFEIPERAVVELDVFDIRGAEVKTLLKGEYLPGIYSVYFTGSNLSSGVYFYQLKSAKKILTKKMLLIK